MKTFLKALLIHNWPRKCLSIILAISIWFLINNSLITTQTIHNIPIKFDNIPPGKMVESNRLHSTVDLTLTGKRSVLQELNKETIEVVINAKGKGGEWIATIRKDNIRSTNPMIDISKGITQVGRQNILIKLVNQATERIPVIITPPIGKAPEGYEFITIWPKKLYVTVTGGEKELSQLKSVKVNLTFNLNKIDPLELDKLSPSPMQKGEDVISFTVPNSWKKVSIPQISSEPIPIDDPAAKHLRIDFIRQGLLTISFPIPIKLYFSPHAQATYTPDTLTLEKSPLITTLNGVPIINTTLYAKGVSPFFLEIAKNMLELVIIIPPHAEDGTCLEWNLQLVNSSSLENRYVHALLSPDGGHKEQQEAHLRNLFHSYTNRVQLFASKKKPFSICPTLSGDSIVIKSKSNKQH